MSTIGHPDVTAARSIGQSGPNRTTIAATAIIIALHAAVIAAVFMASKHPEPIKVAAPHVVMATMINPTPVPVATPTPPKPVTPPKPTPKTPVVHHPTPKPVRTPTPKPTPIAAAPADPTPTPPAPAAPPVKSAPPPPAAPAVDPNIPKNVRHLTCEGNPPDYPALSRRRGETGTVVVQFVVDTQGNVESAKIKSSSGFDRLDDAAKAATLASRCTPYMEGGQAVKAITERPYVFSLAD